MMELTGTCRNQIHLKSQIQDLSTLFEEERREGRPIPSCNFSFTDILTCIMHAACARACRLSPLRRREGGWKKDIKFQSSPLVENFVSQRRAARCRRTETYLYKGDVRTRSAFETKMISNLKEMRSKYRPMYCPRRMAEYPKYTSIRGRFTIWNCHPVSEWELGRQCEGANALA